MKGRVGGLQVYFCHSFSSYNSSSYYSNHAGGIETSEQAAAVPVRMDIVSSHPAKRRSKDGCLSLSYLNLKD